ncbi:MAG: lysophospholipid acyltransferase family protein [Paludibacteraceae bacterium]|nr:lysophospholipid acyltransferase family protein [Paludibacteraceae bacterium]
MMKDFADRIAFVFFYLFVQLVSLLPFRMLYWLSGVFYFLCYYVVRYRRKVVYSNLKSAFPEKSEEERKKIEIESYHWFCDIILESVKAFRMSVADLNERVKYEDMDIMRKHIDNGKSVYMDMAHTGPWEWVPNIYLEYFKDIVGAELYRHVKNKYIDEFLLKGRKRFETLVIPKDKALFPLARLNRDGKIFAIGLLADQTPSRGNLHFWTDFLNHDTAFLQGPERLAKVTKSAVVYLDFRREKRGYYICRFVDICADASLEPDGEVTKRYANLLEQSIRRAPAIWFWTHRRWKYDHQQIIKEDAAREAARQEKAALDKKE